MPAITIKENKTAEAKTVWINAKCSDCCVTTLLDGDGNEIIERDGYVPGFMPEDHYGDYVQLHIDLASGVILNWVAPESDDLQEWIDKDAD